MSAGIFALFFAVLAAAVGGKGQTWLDVLFRGQPQTIFEMPETRAGFVPALAVLRGFLAVPTQLLVSGLVLASAFVSNFRQALLQGAFGPIPGGKLVKKQSLVAGELLVGVLLAVWLLEKLIRFPRVGPDYLGGSSFPTVWPVVAVAFWGGLASMAMWWNWNFPVRIFLATLFLALAIYSIAMPIYYSFAWPTDVIGGVLLGCALFCIVNEVLERVARSPREDTIAS